MVLELSGAQDVDLPENNNMNSIAVIIPCHNEAVTIAAVVRAFKASLPEAEVHVFDNDSSDRTADIARAAGALVHRVPVRGKGEVVRAMFRDVDADLYVMADGDGTYPAERARELLEPIRRGQAEMVVATRLEAHAAGGFRPLHVAGNRMILRTINAFFDVAFTDVLSGYRAFSRRFVKTMPVLSRGFEIETEITLHAAEYRVPVVEIPMHYRARPAGSTSKLRTFRDGLKVLLTIVRLYKDCRPLAFFAVPGFILLFTGVAVGLVVVQEFLELGRVVGVARSVFAVFACIFGISAIATALILETVNRRAREIYHLLADHVVPGLSREVQPARYGALRGRSSSAR
jgi:glycosyltransferase involved in cell wall biosynthesis